MPRFWKERKKAVVLAGLMFVQLLVLSLQVPLGQEASLFERTAFTVLSPIQNVVRGALRGVGNLWNRYVALRRVEDQNREYRDEVFRLRQENALLRDGLDRLTNRDEATAFLRGLGKAFVLAEVIGVDAVSPNKSIIINRGSRHGLRNQMPVVDAQGRLVGRIVNPIGPGEATVQLITDNLSSVGVRGVDHPVSGMLNGDTASGTCTLAYIPASDETLLEGEALVTNGYDSLFPPGLPAGIIVSIKSGGSLFKEIVVKPVFNFRQPAVIAVLTGPPGGGA